ncbi:septal ring lytic transglycosylase RlpA family protein [Kaustia mangrovi]|uniref:Endolytic peptidoglycan transglycosylase RlpA n=1 Tax=Kaustia mangrovi TaxID=2593653 RepID=A0A7S8HEC4_9HYPH|nr:septal ring lytic transglycosylase RlpA family protein [Kaustia mangrovi]QPC45359.1 septal ring lytic transglycosylase RlpA family protein [Kaustia mangrovi]
MTRRTMFLGALALAGMMTGASASSSTQVGLASYYASGSHTASGERFDPSGLTAAHRSLPFGTKVKVEHVKSGRSVVVRINDRGPFIRNRIIDLSRGAARKLGIIKAGVAKVRMTVL